ncbi:tRNA epoxyqueuosine(34) reductase QueG [Amphritea sp. 2_MG-2023]|jgi:epoxyqueuosine reductase|uniref:tRNA epoxyqueuosine(34) reductase QueG n=1 Tax=Amphritea TaxID=515417 RepID=UPI001C07D993|nr:MULTISPECIES: tRNA epoxyqueuosine(34) reductase QueG [Amphritea]MBU2967259.1 tRNA epoxyqueuosine(34) reductase QueG [Amphritea atlantica]MDO6419243.1 tRNA epoxyqueuosine(34) reductase QueG [Amphritea sp. 2_MG-2023]MDX2421635.1 tRNA epoxyqueuosine(34) reductase QueG [Amphritea sp.]
MTQYDPETLQNLVIQIKTEAAALGFQQCGITDTDLSAEEAPLKEWLDKGYQGEMSYLENNVDKRLNPALLTEGTQRIICVRMNCLPPDIETLKILKNPDQAYISRYTMGRDYHKVMRKKLTLLGKAIEKLIGEFGYRAFVDSAPVLERPLARKSGLGWQGKHTLILNREAGSWFLLGELFVDLPLPIDAPYTEEHCGQCQACIDVCPTQAIIAPYKLDARRCISYLTIELKGAIPTEFRPLIGNRIFGCDDCQLICPWNRFAKHSEEADFTPRHQLDHISLLELQSWDEATFLKRTEGSAIRRTGYSGWQRNIAVALGNSRGGDAVLSTLQKMIDGDDPLVREHAQWALESLRSETTDDSTPILHHPRAAKLPD